MDFATLKAFMTNTSIKNNANTTIDCVHKRLTINKVERLVNRNARLRQFRNIPENMSACNTPQALRTDPRLEVPKPALSKPSKIFKEKVLLRNKLLQEYKEKKERSKREQANKKPIFKVTHAALENYNLEQVYGNNLASKEAYKFTAPMNVLPINFMKVTPNAQESPRKRVTRSSTRQQNDSAKPMPKLKLEDIKERPSSNIFRINQQPTKTASKEVELQKSQSLCNLKTPPNKKQVQKEVNLPVAPKALSKPHSQATVRITAIDHLLGESNLHVPAARVNITKSEQILADSSLPSEAINETKEPFYPNNKAANVICRGGTTTLLKTPSKSKSKQTANQNVEKKASQLSLNYKTDEILSEVARRLEKPPSKCSTNTTSMAHSPRPSRKCEPKNIIDSGVNEKRPVLTKTPSKTKITNPNTSAKKFKIDKTASKISLRSKFDSSVNLESNQKEDNEKYAHELVENLIPKPMEKKTPLKMKHSGTSVQKLETTKASKPNPKDIAETFNDANDDKAALVKTLSGTKEHFRTPKTRKAKKTSESKHLKSEVDMKNVSRNPPQKRLTRSHSVKEEQEVNLAPKIMRSISLRNLKIAAPAKTSLGKSTKRIIHVQNDIKKPNAVDIILVPSLQKRKTAKAAKSHPTVDLVGTLQASDSPFKARENAFSKSKTPELMHRTEIDIVDAPAKLPEKRTTRSNSINIFAKEAQQIKSAQEVMRTKSPRSLKTLTQSNRKQLQKNSTNVEIESENYNTDIENDKNEPNTENRRSSFVKTPENGVEHGNVKTNSNSLNTPDDTRESKNCVYVSPFVTVSRGKDSARKEQIQRMGSGGMYNSPGFEQKTSIQTAAEYFTFLLNKETNKIIKKCDSWESFKNDNKLPEEVVDMIDVATGQATLLRNKKMQSFRNLIQYSLEEQTDKPVTCMDLHGYWDVLNMQIDNVSTRFENLSKMRENSWEEILPEKPKTTAIKKVSKPLVKAKRSNTLLDAIKAARLRAKELSAELTEPDSIDCTITPKSNRTSTRCSVNTGNGSQTRVSSLSRTPSNAVRSGSPQIMMQISQLAKSVDRLGSEAVNSAKSILKKRTQFKASGRKSKVVLFDLSDEAREDDIALVNDVVEVDSGVVGISPVTLNTVETQ